MNKYKVLFLPSNIQIEVLEGETLFRAAIRSGVHVNASCGGSGACGKCRVVLEEGEVWGGINERLSSSDVQKNFRLACKSRIKQNVVVRVPDELLGIYNSFDFSQRPIQKAAKIEQFDFSSLKKTNSFDSVTEKIFLKLPKPNKSSRLSDVWRITECLRSYFEGVNFQFDLCLIRKIPSIIRKSNFEITVTLLKSEYPTKNFRITNIQCGDTTDKNFAIAVDIGTTTVCSELFCLRSGENIAKYTSTNKQVSYGEDIISRIVFAEKPGGLEEISDVLLKTVNEVVSETVAIARINVEDISVLMFAGNTTMTQLFLKINPHYIRVSPYIPASAFYLPAYATSLGVFLNDHAFALVYPVVSSYVGGDIVAGVIASGMHKSDNLTLLIDLGTNAEIVLGNRDWLLCAACSAGPAFEGGGIEFGIRAIPGAIEDFSVDPVSLEPMLITIGDVKPRGICGSGLISIVATMFEARIISSSGKFIHESSDNIRIRENEGVKEYVLAWAEETQINRDIVITEIDIGNLIRAKGAIFAGFSSLLSEVGVDIESVDQIILSGGFGSYIDLTKAMTIGLLPEVDPDKVVFLGNSSLLGIKVGSLASYVRGDIFKVVEKMTNCELSELLPYMDKYVASLFLPHTDMSFFPKLRKKLTKR